MKKQLLLMLLVAGAFNQAYAVKDKSAYTPLSSMRSAKRPAIDRLIELMLNKDLMLTSMRTSLNAIKSRSLTANQVRITPEVDALTDEFFDKITQEMFSESVINKIKEAYTKVYTEQEIDELVRFYESPIGQKSLSSIPEITAHVAGITSEVMQKHLNEYVAQMNQLTQKAQEAAATK